MVRAPPLACLQSVLLDTLQNGDRHEINVRDYGRQFLRLGWGHVTVVIVTDQGESVPWSCTATTPSLAIIIRRRVLRAKSQGGQVGLVLPSEFRRKAY